MRALPNRVLFALLIVYIVWGSTYFAIRIGLESLAPFWMMGSRFLVAGAVLFAWLKWRGAPNPSWRQWRDGSIVGVLLLGGSMGMVAVAEQYVSSGMTAVFIASSPLMFAVWGGFFGDWPTRLQWVGIAAGFLGALLLASGSDFSANPVGVLALICAISCWSLGSVLSQKTLKLAPGPMGFASEMMAGGVFLIAAAGLTGEDFSFTVSRDALLAWLYLVTAGSLLAFSAYMYLLSKVPHALAASYSYVNPVIAVILGSLFGGEPISVRQAVAMAVILGSVILLMQVRRTAPAAVAGNETTNDATARKIA